MTHLLCYLAGLMTFPLLFTLGLALLHWDAARERRMQPFRHHGGPGDVVDFPHQHRAES